ncbi:MAG: prepilin-type N-terminal cleavage/methylation domain-containing protein [Candidatus Curtissbacteria bacterium]|nr:prepilin-type N-terminal cleavage/methylation domain-containing protein [Candidatus Curtissbacteria bacterium]
MSLLSKKKRKFGFTLVEVIIVGGLFALVASFSAINILRSQTHSTLVSQVTIFVSDSRSQQVRAMAGDSQGQSTSGDWGIHLENNRYVLFRGSTYSAGDGGNFIVNLGSTMAISWTLPTADIVFVKRSGEVVSYTEGANTVTFTNSASGEHAQLTINRYGSISR